MKKNQIKLTLSAFLIAGGLVTVTGASAQDRQNDRRDQASTEYEFAFDYDRRDLDSRDSDRQLRQRVSREARSYCREMSGDRRNARYTDECRRQIRRDMDQRLDEEQQRRAARRDDRRYAER